MSIQRAGTSDLLEARIVFSALVYRHMQYASILELVLFYYISLRRRKARR
jgi:hypothetical protein